MEAAKELVDRSGIQSNEALGSLRSYYLSLFELSQAKKGCLRLNGNVRVIRWSSGRHFLAIKIEESVRNQP